MARLIWTEQAVSDLAEICDFIGRDSEHYARVFARRIMHTAEGIADFPPSGRLIRMSGNCQVRQRVVGNYRVIYATDGRSARILTVVHGARRGDSDLPQPWPRVGVRGSSRLRCGRNVPKAPWYRGLSAQRGPLRRHQHVPG